MQTARRRARLLVRFATSPADTLLALRMVAWRLVLPALKRRLPLPRLVELMELRAGARERRPEREAQIAEVARVVFRSEHRYRSGNCLERSLVLYRYLSAAGADPELCMGMRRGDGSLRGHAWVIVRGQTVEEPPESLDGFAEVASFRGTKVGGQGARNRQSWAKVERGTE